MQKITSQNYQAIFDDMVENNRRMIAYMKENQNQIGGILGIIQNSLPDPEVIDDVKDFIFQLSIERNVYYMSGPSDKIGDCPISSRMQKFKSLERFAESLKEYDKSDYTVFLREVNYHGESELFGHKREPYFTVRFAILINSRFLK